MSTKTSHTSPSEQEISEEAAEWFLRMSSPDAEPDDEYPTRLVRNAAFRDWYTRSSRHLSAFLDICEVNRLSSHIDDNHRIDITAMLADAGSDVISLHPQAPTAGLAQRNPIGVPKRRYHAVWLSVAATILVIIGTLAGMFQWNSLDFTTGIGEQRTAKLEDGSIVYLNTDTRVAVDYSRSQRTVRLLKGEALFVVEHDPRRPFIVVSENARIRAVGTQFNVRDRTSSVDVAVIQGVVEVGTSDAVTQPHDNDAHSAATTSFLDKEGWVGTSLQAGEIAHVSPGRVVTSQDSSITDTVSWRDRRLIFHNATLADVAAEFNRYNRVQLKVDPALAEAPMFKAAIFDADRPQALVLYASRDPSLIVESEGQNWIIRPK